MKRWYEHWLKKASTQERHGLLETAIVCLGKAEKHTFDPDELMYLRIWLNRLKKESVNPTPTENAK